jgi:hypothetical protein
MKTATTAQVLLLGYLLLFSLFVASDPQYYWDVVPYVATTLLNQHSDSVTLHEATYSLLAGQLTPVQFQGLVADDFAAAIYHDPQALWSQLPMYQSKPLYVGALRVLYFSGINPVDGLLLLSLLPALAILLLVYGTLSRYCSPCKALLLVMVFAFAARLTDLTQGLVHNNLANLLVLAGSLALLEARRTDWAVILFLLALLTRTDNIFYIGLCQALLCWRYAQHPQDYNTKEGIWRFSGLLLYPLAYLLIASSTGQNWWTLFYHTLIESQLQIQQFDQAFSWQLYWQVLAEALGALFSSGVTLVTVQPLFLLLLVLTNPLQHYGGLLKVKAGSYQSFNYADCGLIILLVMLIYLLLFPLLAAWDRFFTHFYALILIAAAQRIPGSSTWDTINGVHGAISNSLNPRYPGNSET